MKTIVFFNNQGGLGNATLVYHLAWMYASLGVRVVAADLDPQANLSSMFLSTERLDELWADGRRSIIGAIRPMLNGIDDIEIPHIEPVPPLAEGAEQIGLLVGDPGLGTFEDKLSDAWFRCLEEDEFAFRVISSLFRLLVQSARSHECELVLISIGPGMGAINRAAAIAAHHVVLPIEPDLFSLQSVRYLGPTLRHWRVDWKERLPRKPDPELPLPFGTMELVGYILFRQARRVDGPFREQDPFWARVSPMFRQYVLGLSPEGAPPPEEDPSCLALLNPYRILWPMAMATRRPMFLLRSEDGARGAHERAVRECYAVFEKLAEDIAARCQLELPAP